MILCGKEDVHVNSYSAQRLTIWDKMQILKYADETRQASEEALASVKRSKKKQHKKQRKFIRGLNLQRSCELKFGAKLGGINLFCASSRSRLRRKNGIS